MTGYRNQQKDDNLTLYFAASHTWEDSFQKFQRYIRWPSPMLWKNSSDFEALRDDQQITLTENRHERVDLRL